MEKEIISFMKFFRLYYFMFKFEHSKSCFDYVVKRRKLFFWLNNQNVALITIIPNNYYTLISLEKLNPRAIHYICYKTKKIANI